MIANETTIHRSVKYVYVPAWPSTMRKPHTYGHAFYILRVP